MSISTDSQISSSNCSSETKISLLSLSKEQIDYANNIRKDSVHHDFQVQMANKQLSLILNQSYRNLFVEDINHIDLKRISKTELREFKRNPDFFVRLGKINHKFNTHPREFGDEWDKAHKDLLRAEFNKLSFISQPSFYHYSTREKTTPQNSIITSNTHTSYLRNSDSSTLSVYNAAQAHKPNRKSIFEKLRAWSFCNK